MDYNTLVNTDITLLSNEQLAYKLLTNNDGTLRQLTEVQDDLDQNGIGKNVRQEKELKADKLDDAFKEVVQRYKNDVKQAKNFTIAYFIVSYPAKAQEISQVADNYGIDSNELSYPAKDTQVLKNIFSKAGLANNTIVQAAEEILKRY